ncbi:G5 and 3D domain-containing protein [Halobacillus sp. A5]|uniref:G5 and 3D domain-containing protein n=1 Tax=Halobacillus sp. A5 TaxID=2880263 RepID=UPI0020A65A63|nr:G5 and 3D domain-containing protein [Halobacillus sp. A5]MCP3029706.1 ubiquitin-like domain-containing protein [Halobacillus sp. A5]
MKLMKNTKAAITSALMWTLIISAFTITFLGFVTYEATKASVKVTHDGETQVIRTHAQTFEDLLQELDIKPEAHDRLSHELSEPIEYGMDVEYIASKSINLAINDDTKQFHTTASTVGEFFEEQELEWKEHDEISHDSRAPIEEEMGITVDRAIQITLNDGGEEEEVWTTASTVDELLDSEHINLGELDELNMKKNESLHQNDHLDITRIEKKTETIEEDVEYKVVTEKDDSLPNGEEKVVTSGEDGKVTKEFEIIIKNGKESKRELVKEKVDKESIDEVVALGTKEESAPEQSRPEEDNKSNSSEPTLVSTSSDSSSKEDHSSSSKEEESSSNTMKMKATAYTASCSGCTGKTATGIDLNSNPGKKVIAVDPSVIPLGSEVWVEGYGTAVAGDTGGAIKGNKIDVHVASTGEAQSFGSKTVDVKVLD